MATILFIYGTLKTGEHNHHLLSGKKRGLCRLVGRARTLEKYPLVIASPYNIPFLLYKSGTGQIIEGELYEVDSTQLELMDDLEKHPHWYERREVRVQTTGGELNTREITVQTYFLVKFQPNLLNLPTYSSYSNGTDGKMFSLPPNDVSGEDSWLSEIHVESEKLRQMMKFGEHLKL